VKDQRFMRKICEDRGGKIGRWIGASECKKRRNGKRRACRTRKPRWERLGFCAIEEMKSARRSYSSAGRTHDILHWVGVTLV